MIGPRRADGVRRLGFVTWTDDRPTGGNVYNEALVSALESLGTEVVLHRVPGRWPEADRIDRERLGMILRTEQILLVDGIVASGAPDAMYAAVASGRQVTVLLHMLAADEVGLTEVSRARRFAAEGRTLRSASGVLTPSRHAARRVAERYGRVEVAVAPTRSVTGPTGGGQLER